MQENNTYLHSPIEKHEIKCFRRHVKHRNWWCKNRDSMSFILFTWGIMFILLTGQPHVGVSPQKKKINS